MKDIDITISSALSQDAPSAVPDHARDRVLRSNSYFKRTIVQGSAQRAVRDGRMLNDEAVYCAIGALCKNVVSSKRLSKFAFFSTYEFTRWIDGMLPGRLFELTAYTVFWQCPIIFVPIHYGVHWMVAVVYADEGRIDFFDSLGLYSNFLYHAKVRLQASCSARRR